MNQELLNTYSLTSSQATAEVKNDWPCLAYTITLLRQGKQVWQGEYSLGIGHAGKVPSEAEMNSIVFRIPRDGQRLMGAYYAYRSHPHCTLVNKQLTADFWTAVANKRKIIPKLEYVLHSLLLDSSAYKETFEDWCDLFGYDSDSRKAEKIYNACLEIARSLYTSIPAAEIDELKTLLEDY